MIPGLLVIISALNETDIRIIKIAITPDIEERVGFSFFRIALVRYFRKIVFKTPTKTKGITIRKKRFFIRIRKEKYDECSNRKGRPKGMRNNETKDKKD